MSVKTSNVVRLGLSAAAIGLGMAGSASATEGYFLDGVGAREQALGGAGVADSKDALTLANNPAGLTEIGQQLNIDLSAFAPSRQYQASGTALVAPGTVKSGRDVFTIPAFAYSQPLTSDSSIGVALYGNGGMDTSYYTNKAGAFLPAGYGGVFGGGHTGVDLQQAFLVAGYAKKFGTISVGVAPVLAFQQFKAYGLGLFGAYNLSSNAEDLSNRGTDTSVGGGLRLGVQVRASDVLSLGLTGTTPIWSSKFSKYAGLFTNGGSFDIPGEIGVGLAYKLAPNLTALLDYKRIFYSDVSSVGNSSAFTSLLGSSNGPGFGWRDVDVIALGLEWQARDSLTLRAGYAHNTNPVTSANVTFNILAPAVVTDHFSAGASYKVTGHSSIDFAAVVVPKASVSGYEVTPFGTNTASNIRLSMSQFQATLGYTYHFN